MDTEVVGLGRYWAALRRRAWVVVVLVAVCAAALGGYLSLRTPAYSASADVLISPYTTGSGTEPAFTTGQVDTQVAVIQSLRVVAPVASRLDPTEDATTLQKSVTAAAVGDTSVIQVTVSRSNAAQAAAIANAVARQYVAFRNNAGLPLGAVGSFATIVGLASPAQAKSGPSLALGTGVGAVIGLVLGCVVALLVDRRDKSLKDETATAEVTGGLPVLGRIPPLRKRARGPAVAADRTSKQAVAYRFLGAAVRLRRTGPGPAVVLVLSAAPKDGRTSVAANLALAAADAGDRVVLLDADLGQPALTRLWELDREVTLETLTQRTLPVGLDLLSRPAPNLYAVGSADPQTGHLGMLGSGRLRHVVGRLPESVDLVVVDTSPLLSAAEVLDLVRQADVVLLVVRERVSKEPDVTAALDLVRQVGGSITGVVVTGSSASLGTQRTSRRRAADAAPATPATQAPPTSEPKAVRS